MYLWENASNTTLYEKQIANARNHAKNHYNKVGILNLRSICQKKLIIKWHYHSANTSENQKTIASTNTIAVPAALNKPLINIPWNLSHNYFYILNFKLAESCCNPITFSTPANTFWCQYTCTHTHSLTHTHTLPQYLSYTLISLQSLYFCFS